MLFRFTMGALLVVATVLFIKFCIQAVHIRECSDKRLLAEANCMIENSTSSEMFKCEAFGKKVFYECKMEIE